MAICLYFGIVKIEKVKASEIDLAITSTASATVILSALIGCFFALRFFLFAYRDQVLVKFERAPASVELNNKVQPVTAILNEREARGKAIILEYAKDDIDVEIREIKIQILNLETEEKLLPHQAILNIITKSIDRIEFIDSIRRYAEFWFTGVFTFAAVFAATTVVVTLLR